MSAGMAEVIAAHTQLEWEAKTGRSFCECGVKLCTVSMPIIAQHRKLYAHVAEELTKAGYGRLEGAWDAGRKHGATWPYGKKGLAVDENPYRTGEAPHGVD